jgi:glyceraldehyde-3-phosphate dehydrogenase (NADP+)
MEMQDRLTAMLRREEDIPESYRFGPPVAQQEYLVDGELRTWTGPTQEVRSPVFLKTGETPEAKLLGSYPLMTGTEAVAALDAAVRAYGNGAGTWPSMPLETRLRHMEHFTHLMVAQKADVVQLLMWEIGNHSVCSNGVRPHGEVHADTSML